MEFIIKNTSSSYPKTYFQITIIDISYINTYQVISLNFTFCNILFKIIKTKKNEKTK